MNAKLLSGAIVAVAGMTFSAHAQCQASKKMMTTTQKVADKSECQATCSGSKDMMTAQTVSYSGAPTIVETAIGNGNFKTLVAAVQAAGLVDALNGDGPFTVFAPTDAAFAKLPAGTVESLVKPENRELLTSILTYHVVPGAVDASSVVNLSNAATLNGQRIDIASNKHGVRIDNANVTATDIRCSNGIIHVIDSVIMPSTKNIVETASEAGSFGTLLTAATEAGLADLLQSKGPFTVFAPTDEAFEKLAPGTVATLLKPENRDQLVDILKFHVVPGRVYATDFVKAGNGTTAQGSAVRAGIDGGRLTVNGVNILNTDLETSNGVIHVIDEVLLP